MQKMIDLHCHILPDVDDGTKTEKEMREVLETAWKQGISEMIATPHYPGEAMQEDRVRMKKWELVKEAALAISPEFRIHSGNELFWMNGLPEALEEKKALSLAGSRYVLVEFNPGEHFGSMQEKLRELVRAGWHPVLAHMERYECLHKNWDRIEKLTDEGCYLQMNMASLTGSSLKSSVRFCRRLVKEGWIHFMGTDTHGMHYRPIDITAARGWIMENCDSTYAEQILYENAKTVIENKIL